MGYAGPYDGALVAHEIALLIIDMQASASFDRIEICRCHMVMYHAFYLFLKVQPDA